MDSAAVWLAGSILVMLGFVVVVAGCIVVNNILHKYWKPVKFFTADSFNINPPHRFAHEEELSRLAPHLEKEQESKK